MTRYKLGKLALVIAVAAIPLTGASSASAFSGSSTAAGFHSAATEVGESSDMLIRVQSFSERLQRLQALRAAISTGRPSPATVAVVGDRRFARLVASLRCRRNPDAFGCGLVSPSVR